MKNLDYRLITECLIGRQTELKEHIAFYKMSREHFGINSNEYDIRISLLENKLIKINEELEKIKQVRLNLYLEN